MGNSARNSINKGNKESAPIEKIKFVIAFELGWGAGDEDWVLVLECTTSGDFYSIPMSFKQINVGGVHSRHSPKMPIHPSHFVRLFSTSPTPQCITMHCCSHGFQKCS